MGGTMQPLSASSAFQPPSDSELPGRTETVSPEVLGIEGQPTAKKKSRRNWLRLPRKRNWSRLPCKKESEPASSSNQTYTVPHIGLAPESSPASVPERPPSVQITRQGRAASSDDGNASYVGT